MKSSRPFLILLIASLSACNHAPKKPAIGTAKNHLPGYPNSGDIVQTYTQYLRSLDSLDLSTSQLAQKEFDTLFSVQSPPVCDTGFMLYWTFLHILNTQDSGALAKFIGHAGVQEKATQQKLTANNFVVGEEEGGSGSYLDPAWTLVGRHFSKFISVPMKEVIEQETIGEKRPFLNDDALIVDPSDLVHRAIWWEQFQTRYPHHIYDSTARSNYNVLVYVMIAGVDNTPVAGFDSTQSIDPYYDSVYKLLHDSFPDSRANTIIAPWWRALLAKDTMTMKKIRDTIPLY
jgi:hypothetical protein